ncbi:hypothetical protein BRADI_4g28730v3 [Brachypodium distachyon]|uniref:Uncharacterized protein n=1 Tax=Brachypodium distachyon TaxID=15368 RepID=A0A2K2CQZ3_BRADI|nr:hypothetical protein BRADI_4g28730v3 [Brachypodium distachyon]
MRNWTWGLGELEEKRECFGMTRRDLELEARARRNRDGIVGDSESCVAWNPEAVGEDDVRVPPVIGRGRLGLAEPVGPVRSGFSVFPFLLSIFCF